MPEVTIGMTKGGAFVPEIVANKALGALEAELHLAKNVARDADYTSQKIGDVIKVPVRGAVTANRKLQNTKVTVQDPTATTVDVTLDQHWEVTFAVEDIVKTLATGEQVIQDGYIADGMIALAEQIETALATLALTFTHTLGSQGVAVTGDLVKQARADLTTRRAPRMERYLYITPENVNNIVEEAVFVSTEKYGSSAVVQDGELGKIYGFRTMESIFPVEDGSPATTYNMAFQRNAMVLATRALAKPMAPGVKVGYVEKDGIIIRVIYSYDAANLADQITLDTLFGVAIMRDDLCVILKS